MKGGTEHRACSGALKIGIVMCIEKADCLNSPVMEISAVLLPPEESSDIDRPEIIFGVSLIDPLGQGLSCTARTRNSHRVHPAGDEKILNTRGLPEHICVVRGEAFGGNG